jgi:DNA-binding transcriptional ArsR family regulator
VNQLELLGQPVRLRIVHAMRGRRTLTATQLCDRLPDISKATVYRHIDVLTDGGILEVAEERRVRGAVERHYRLRQDRVVIDADTLQSLTAEDHRRGFGAAVAALLAEFNAYLDRGDADLLADLVNYRQHALWLSRDELNAVLSELRATILPRLANPPTPDRAQYLLSPILFPVEEPPAPEAGEHEPTGPQSGE